MNMETRGQRKGCQSRQPRNQRVDNGSDIDQNTESRAGGGNRPVAFVRTYEMITQQGSGLSEVMEGTNFKNEILLRGEGCEDPQFYLFLFYFTGLINYLLTRFL